MFKIIPIEIFVTDLLVSIAETDDEIYDHVCHRYSREEFDLAFDDWTERSDARTVTHRDGFVLIRFRNVIEDTPEHIGLVAHEVYHATYSILAMKGIRPCYETEEVYAYLIQYLVTEILKIKENGGNSGLND